MNLHLFTWVLALNRAGADKVRDTGAEHMQDLERACSMIEECQESHLAGDCELCMQVGQ
jgi:hypothetical protein